MTRSTFGQREAKRLAHTQAQSLKDHAAYTRGGASSKKGRRHPDGSLIDRMLAWLSYFTLVLTSAIALTPDSAAAAALTVHQIVTTALPG